MTFWRIGHSFDVFYCKLSVILCVLNSCNSPRAPGRRNRTPLCNIEEVPMGLKNTDVLHQSPRQFCVFAAGDTVAEDYTDFIGFRHQGKRKFLISGWEKSASPWWVLQVMLLWLLKFHSSVYWWNYSYNVNLFSAVALRGHLYIPHPLHPLTLFPHATFICQGNILEDT